MEKLPPDPTNQRVWINFANSTTKQMTTTAKKAAIFSQIFIYGYLKDQMEWKQATTTTPMRWWRSEINWNEQRYQAQVFLF